MPSIPAEEAFVQQLQQLKRRLVDLGPGTARVQQRHVDDGRVVVTRILPAEEGGCSCYAELTMRPEGARTKLHSHVSRVGLEAGLVASEPRPKS